VKGLDFARRALEVAADSSPMATFAWSSCSSSPRSPGTAMSFIGDVVVDHAQGRLDHLAAVVGLGNDAIGTMPNITISRSLTDSTRP
jgi:hypothetical protein